MRRLQELDLLRFISPYLTFEKDKEKLFHQMHDVYKWYELLYKGKPCDRISYYVLGLVDHMKADEVFDFCRKTEMTERLRRRTVENASRIKDALTRLSYGGQTLRKSEVYRIYETLSEEGKLFIMARTRSDEVKKSLSNYITYSESLKPLLTGGDLKAMDIREGPIYREILDKLKDAKVDRSLKTREEEMAFVSEYLRERGLSLERASHSA